MLKDANELSDLQSHILLTKKAHYGPFVSVKTNVKSRLLDTRIVTLAFIYGDRHCDLRRYIQKIDNALTKVDRAISIYKGPELKITINGSIMVTEWF